MRAREVCINCKCGGAIIQTSLRNDEGLPVAFWLTEDEKILFRGWCSKCGEELQFKYPLLTLLFDAPSTKEVM